TAATQPAYPLSMKSLHRGGSRSLRQMARRPAHLGPSHRRGPHPTRRPAVPDKGLPNLERSQHVRAHQAGLPRRHRPRRLTSSMRPPTAAQQYVNPVGIIVVTALAANAEGIFLTNANTREDRRM